MMKLPRRHFLHLAAGAAALPAVSRTARAQAYPAKPVRIIVGFGSDSAADILARLIGQWLSERLAQPFVIETRGGIGIVQRCLARARLGAVCHNLGTEAVVRAPPDGYTLLLCSSPDTINAILHDKLDFRFLRDLAPVAGIARGPNVLVVHPSFPAKTVPEFIAHAKANPGKVRFASAGIGSMSHVSGELFKAMARVNMVHVPYRSLAPALTDLIGGQVQAIFSSTTPSIEFVRAGKLRALAVTSATRSQALPDLPTIGDFLPGYEASLVTGLGAPRNIPAEIVERLNKEINAALADQGMKARLADLGNAPMTMTPAEFINLIADETDKWAKVIRTANIRF
jgi:tripartite-type tricarboxylate transporter receptor subunit TctC